MIKFVETKRYRINRDMNESLRKISPIDGRYSKKTEELQDYFSEYGLIRYRVKVEIEYFIALCDLKIPQLSAVDSSVFAKIRKIYKEFSIKDAKSIKDIEAVTNHDVKAVEYFIKQKFDNLNLGEYKEFVHFGLTSQDINNTATSITLKKVVNDVYIPKLKGVLDILKSLSFKWKEVPMLARTHGQPASPTRIGKEIKVFIERVEKQIDLLNKISISSKFGGATGNFNAHHVAYPDYDWVKFANEFLTTILGIERQQTTTQIEHYDNLGAICDNISRINTILIDFSRDIWMYISIDYFKQKINENEVGSSAMPHKVNPIDFENAEGNLGIANSIFSFLSKKLPISRLQRDLTDSTVLRNLGVPFGHTLIALSSLEKGLAKLILNEEKIRLDLEDNWLVVSEGVQNILRREGYSNPYELLKSLTRKNEKINHLIMKDFIEGLEISADVKKEILKITPFNYTGI